MLGPGFFVHYLISFYGGEPRVVLCREEDGYHLDVDRLGAAITDRTKALLLINPGNPTGVVYTNEELQEIAELAESHDLLVISDEAYERFVYDGNVHISIASLPGMARRTLTVHSFTKCYGLRAGRIGYAAGHEELVGPVAKAFEWATLTGNPASQAMARAALVGPQDWIEDGMRELLDNRDLIRRRVRESELISTVVPQGATFYYLNFSRLGVGEEEFCSHLLARYGVPTVPGASFAGGDDAGGVLPALTVRRQHRHHRTSHPGGASRRGGRGQGRTDQRTRPLLKPFRILRPVITQRCEHRRPPAERSARRSVASDVRSTISSSTCRVFDTTMATEASITSDIPAQPHSSPARRAIVPSRGTSLHRLSVRATRTCRSGLLHTWPITPAGTRTA